MLSPAARLLPALLAAFPVAAAAQSILTVGPNGQFADLPAAVAAARAGDIVHCLSFPFQVVTATTVQGKGITIYGDAVGLNGRLIVRNVPAGQRMVVYGFVPMNGVPAQVTVQDCAGRVHLDRLLGSTVATTIPPGPSIDIARCASVSLTSIYSYGTPAVRAVDSVVDLSLCKFGLSAASLPAGGRALELDRCRVSISQCSADGGREPISTVFARDSRLTIAGRWRPGEFGDIRGAFANGVQLPAIEAVGSTSVLLGDEVVIDGPVLGVTPTVRRVPYQVVFGARLGFQLQVSTYGPIGGTGAVALSGLAPARPSPLGEVWLDPVAHVAVPFVLDTGGRHWFLVNVPQELPIGSAFTAQGILLSGGVTEFTVANTFTLYE